MKVMLFLLISSLILFWLYFILAIIIRKKIIPILNILLTVSAYVYLILFLT